MSASLSGGNKWVIALSVFLFLVSTAHSHDMWLLPERFTPSKGQRLRVFQLVGHDLEIEVILPLRKELTGKFGLITPDGAVDLLGELPDETHPVLEGKLDFEGLALLTMEHNFLNLELSDEKFSEYLKHEGFEEVAKLRARIGPKPKQRERYARTLKSLIQVGGVAAGDLYKQVVGQKIEILLLQNPYLLGSGDDLDVKVLFNGKPLGQKLVWAYNEKGQQLLSQLKKRTNSQGIARFNLKGQGFWLIRCVHLLACAEPDVDWESYWASYTFRLE